MIICMISEHQMSRS